MPPMKWTTLLIGKWSWYRLPLSLASIWLLLAFYAVFFADRMIFIPPPPSYDEQESNLVFFQTDDGIRIAALDLPAAAEKHGSPCPAPATTASSITIPACPM